jgi:hypothetical protein
MIIDDRLYLGGVYYFSIFNVTSSLTQPLIPGKVISTYDKTNKILRVGNELLLGQAWGLLQVFDIETSTFTSKHRFTEAGDIYDIIAIDETHYLLAADKGLFKTTKNQVINQYHLSQGWLFFVSSLCHITD